MTLPVPVLVIDDEEVMRDSCSEILGNMGCDVQTARDGEEGLRLIKDAAFAVVILDLKMPGLSGLELLEIIRKNDPETVVIVITGYPTIQNAIEAIKLGAYDFLPKPFTPDEFRAIIKRAFEKRKLSIENLYLSKALHSKTQSDIIIGQSEAMCEISRLVQKVGPTDSTVLITGESGTGKELVARAIHAGSMRKDMPFITIDCGTLVENLFESELFGHVRGSFTGAASTKHGLLELANNGTVFFDEIGNIGTHMQSKLLRAIQEREITKVGGTQTVKIDIRIIAATNKDLSEAVKENSFREDLFYRLSVVPVHLPPLRKRKADIPLLAKYFIDKYNEKRRKSIKGMSNSTMKAFMHYNWPGNVRELENAIERAVVLSENEYLEPEDLHYYGLSILTQTEENKTLDQIEKEYIKNTLLKFKGHKIKAAESLGIDRKTLYRKIKKYDLTGL